MRILRIRRPALPLLASEHFQERIEPNSQRGSIEAITEADWRGGDFSYVNFKSNFKSQTYNVKIDEINLKAW